MGVVSMSEDPEKNPELAAQLVEQAKAQNHAWRVSVVRGFEAQLQHYQLSGHGRLEPSLLENESYRALGMELPGTLEAIKAKSTTKINLSPELMELLQLGLQAKQESTAKAAR